jgi:uncharacterized membrane protein
VLSFAVSAIYWISQQQRLAMSRSVTMAQARLHLVFLFLIVLVPISTSFPTWRGRERKWRLLCCMARISP